MRGIFPCRWNVIRGVIWNGHGGYNSLRQAVSIIEPSATWWVNIKTNKVNVSL